MTEDLAKYEAKPPTGRGPGFKKDEIWVNLQTIDIAAAVARKHEYNITRPYRHGNKLC